MTTMTDTTARETMRQKIEKLLAKAERTDNPHEAEAFQEKAENLMAEWGIEAAMCNATKTEAERERVTEDRMQFTGKYAKGMVLFAALIAEGLGGLQFFETRRRGENNRRAFVLIGHESDVERANMLITSLQLQATSALRVWWRTYAMKEWMTEAEKFQARRQFLISFAEAVRDRLTERRREQEAATDARREHATSTGSPEASGPSVALVLADRAQEVTAYVAQHYPKLGKARAMQGSRYGAGAGAQAGRSASLGDRGSVNGGARAAIA